MKMFKILALSLIFCESLAMYMYNDTELNTYQRSDLINKIIDNLGREIKTLEKQFKESGINPELKKKMVNLRKKIAEEKDGAETGQLYMAESMQRKRYTSDLKDELEKIENLLRQAK